MQKGKDAALLECRPITGRTHQIRVHCSGMGHPILGDYQYGRKFRCSVRPPRCLLHAFEVIFIDPIKDSEVHVRAPLPKDMEQALESMRKKDNYENIDH
jgi:23S rRNA-/tRNA-specific pseudouridylate synthase